MDRDHILQSEPARRTLVNRSDGRGSRAETQPNGIAQFFLQVAPMLNNMFLAPVQIVVAFIWLAFIIGPSFLAGLGVMFFSVPLQVRTP